MTGYRKLTDRQVLEIRALVDKPGVYGTDVAKKYGVSPSEISRIWTGKRRTNVKGGNENVTDTSRD